MSTPRQVRERLEQAPLTLWWRRPSDADLARARVELPAEERERLARFRADEPARQYATARLALRELLDDLGPIPAAAWRLTVGEFGRPELDRDLPGFPAELERLSFNLSHTRGLVVVGLSLAGTVGVDTESTLRANDLPRIARFKFAPAEQDWVLGAPDESELAERFFRIWTLKESYVKARGTGIGIGLENFAFTCPEQGPTGIRFEPDFDPRPEAWSFGWRRLGDEHRLAWALWGTDGAIDVADAPLVELD